MKYIKQLDSLRAIAVILVIIHHWVPPDNPIHRIPYGPIGVDIFFVLSGFLISKILFDNRNNSELLNIPKSTLLKNFYIRRSLRIFPIYYLTIFTLLLFSESTGTNIKSSFIYFATYTSNFYFFSIREWDGMLSHLWTLAVEEQFYLIWPWIIIFTNKKYLFHVITVFILIGVVSQHLMSDEPMSVILTFTCFDSFGLGAILAWITTYANERLKKFYQIISVVSALSLFLFVLGIVQQQWIFIPFRTIVSLIALWVITYVIRNQETNSLKFKFLFNNRILIFIGKISYGIYLYHHIIPETINLKIINRYLNPLLPDLLYVKYWNYLFLVENAIILTTVSWLSYVFIEKQFLSLKKYFEYEKESRLQPSVEAGLSDVATNLYVPGQRDDGE